MSFRMPAALLGTSQIRPDARAGFGPFLDSASESGRGTLLTEGGAWVWETLQENDRLSQWDYCGLVPHVAGYVREATDYGMLGAGWRRLRRMNPLSWFRLGWQGMLNVRGVLRKDFPTLLGILLELEMANFRKVQPKVVFLHPQMTDLLLAMDHGPALAKALDKIRHGFGCEPGLATYNLGTLLPRLQSWGLEVPYMFTHLHPEGYGMRPSQEDCEELLNAYEGRVIATTDEQIDTKIANYWQTRGVGTAAYDVASPKLDQWRAWQTWQAFGGTTEQLASTPTLREKSESMCDTQVGE